MDTANTEANARLQNNKAYFKQFLERGPFVISGNNYKEKVRTLLQDGKCRLIVSLDDLRIYDEERFPGEKNVDKKLLKEPGEWVPAFDIALKEFVVELPDQLALGTVLEEYFVGFDGAFGGHTVTPRDLNTNLLRCMVNVEGIITKLSLLKPKLVTSVHYSDGKKSNKPARRIVRQHRDITTSFGLPTAPVYPTRDEDDNILTIEYGMSQYRDYQKIVLQEMPEKAPPGQIPRSVEIICENDLCDVVKPGDRLSVVGIYRALPNMSDATQTKGVFSTVLLANNIQMLGKEISGPQLTPEDVANIKELAKNDAFKVLSQSLAPSIYGHDHIKKAILLQLVGGNEKNLVSSGIHLRGDINILMVGDPGTAKSQLLRFVLNVAPLAISTSGRGSTGVGLTAAVVQDSETGDRRLEAGAMVLADRGTVCIDEFDKMSVEDRVAIHEVMEQQTVTISKAGIHASLNARCSVLAAANPIYGKYDATQTAMKNIALPDSLLSRFDLLFIVLDKMDPAHDRSIAEHVLRMHRYQTNETETSAAPVGGALEEQGADIDPKNKTSQVYLKYNKMLHGLNSKRQICSIPFVKKYILYAKRKFSPVPTEEAVAKIVDAYDELRKREDTRTLPVTARTLETMIRLSVAHAKLRLSTEATEEDATAALDLMRFALYNDSHGTDGDGTNGGGSDDDDSDDDDDDGGNNDTKDVEASAVADLMDIDRSRTDDLDDVPRPKRKRGSQVEADTAMDVIESSSTPGGSSKPKKSKKQQESAPTDESVGTPKKKKSGFDKKRFELVQGVLREMFKEESEGEGMLTKGAILNRVNKKAGKEHFNSEELDRILEKIQDENKILLENDFVHLV